MLLTAHTIEVQDKLQSQPNWQETYRALLQEAKNAPLLAAELRHDANRVHGCEATVWLRVLSTASARPGASPEVSFEFASDARMVQALIHIALLPLQGQSAQDIALFDMETWMHSCGLDRHLSPSRSNGLAQVVKAAREAAAQALSSAL